MRLLVTMGALLKCSCGLIPVPLIVLPRAKVRGLLPYASQDDHIPVCNILPFGMCRSILNPAVAAATLSHLGVLTPMPCLPITPGKWSGCQSSVKIGGSPALTNKSQLKCVFGGKIEITFPGQVQVITK